MVSSQGHGSGITFQTPPHIVRESPSAFEATVLLPGVASDGLRLQVEDDILTIMGQASPGAGTRLSKRHDGPLVTWLVRFQPGFPLTEERLESRFEDAVLHIRIEPPTPASQDQSKVA